ncbi:MAG: AMP-binding protein, partial [Chloroflexi bacterium]|nr:AMP-binding protein [Chloroflexota bacterium]
KYIVEHSDSKIVVVQDQEQADKMLTIKDELPAVRKVICWDYTGMGHYDDPILMRFDEVLKLGQEYEVSHPDVFEQNISLVKAEDAALIMYTSGTTGLPKGAVMTHMGLYDSLRISFSLYEVYETDEWLSFILPGWMGEQCYGLLNSLVRGFKMNFPEEQATVQGNLREISPQIIFYPSRLWETIASSIQNSMTESAWPDRLMYKLFMPIGYRVADAKFSGKKLNPFWMALYELGKLLLFNPLRDRHGLLKLRCAFTGGAAFGPEIFRLITAIGVDLRQSFGSSEMGISQHCRGEIKVDSVGRVNPETIVRIADDNHILVRGTATTTGYYKNPEATEKAFAGGWYHTGDAGVIDDEGHIYYLDRLEYMRRLADGTRYAPQYIESRMKFSPFVKDAFVVGDETKDFVGLVINIDFDNIGNWAEKRHIPYTTFADLSQKPEVCQLLKNEVAKVNRLLPGNLEVKRFVNTPKEFDPDEAELTRTMKLRRGFLEGRYQRLLEAIYGEKEVVVMETPVVYRDGRTSVVSTKISVTDV